MKIGLPNSASELADIHRPTHGLNQQLCACWLSDPAGERFRVIIERISEEAPYKARCGRTPSEVTCIMLSYRCTVNKPTY